MKVVFAHNHNFIYSSGKYYSNGSFGLEVLERYTNVFGNLTVLSRQEKKDNIEKTLTLSSGENIEFIKIPNLNSLIGLTKYKAARQIIDYEIMKADYVIARLPSTIGNLAIECAKKNNKPYLIELVGCPWDALWNHSIKGKIIAPFKYLSAKKQIANADYVLYVTSQFLQKRYPTAGTSVNCSNVSLTEFDDEVILKRLNSITVKDTNGKKIIGTIGAVDVKYKNQEAIIKALGKIKKQGNTNYEYQLVGSGNYNYLLGIARENNVENQVKFLGSISHKKIFSWLDSIDLYVQPSKTEGLPRALIEAMSRGLPSFGSDAGGIPELLENNYVFSNTKKNIDEICEMLLSFDKENMLAQSKRNYEESKKYDKNIIEEKRAMFFKKFKYDNATFNS